MAGAQGAVRSPSLWVSLLPDDYWRPRKVGGLLFHLGGQSAVFLRVSVWAHVKWFGSWGLKTFRAHCAFLRSTFR